jgi:hypothetical protein
VGPINFIQSGSNEKHTRKRKRERERGREKRRKGEKEKRSENTPLERCMRHEENVMGMQRSRVPTAHDVAL